MTRMIRTTIALAALALSAGALSDSDDEFETVKGSLAERFPNLEVNEISRTPVPGLVEIRQGAMVAYLSVDGRYLFRGDVIDLEQDRNLTETAMAKGRVEMLAQFDDDDGVTFAPKDRKHTVTVFTDVDCGWCRTLHREIEQYNELGIAVRYLMWPRGGPDSAAWDKAERVWCSADRQRALTQAKSDQALPEADCDASIVRRHFETGLRMGVGGTPAIVTEDGQFISGYKSATDLAAMLAVGEVR